MIRWNSQYIFYAKREFNSLKYYNILILKGYDILIKRHIYSQILDSINSKTVTLITGFKQLDKTKYQIGSKAIICNTDSVYPLDNNVYVLPLAGI